MRTFTLAMATIAVAGAEPLRAAIVGFNEPFPDTVWDGGLDEHVKGIEGLAEDIGGTDATIILFKPRTNLLGAERSGQIASAIYDLTGDNFTAAGWFTHGENEGQGTWTLSNRHEDASWPETIAEADVTVDEATVEELDFTIEPGTLFLPFTGTQIEFGPFSAEALGDLYTHVTGIEGLAEKLGDARKVVLITTADLLTDEQRSSLARGIYELFKSEVAVASYVPGANAEDEGKWVVQESDDLEPDTISVGQEHSEMNWLPAEEGEPKIEAATTPEEVVAAAEEPVEGTAIEPVAPVEEATSATEVKPEE